MRQLSGMDASFLNLETPVQQGHVAGVVVVDPTTAPNGFGFAAVRELIASRLHLLPPFRRRLVEVPFGVDHPYWIEDPDFDLDFHLRHIAVPAPGGKRQLADLVARLHERPLDRSRPLWEIYVIEGLEDGYVATFTKLHHAAVDGVSGAEILTILLDATPEGRELADDDSWRPDRVPGQMELLARGWVGMMLQPAKAARAGVQLARSVPALRRVVDLPSLLGLRKGHDVLSQPRLVAPRSALNGPITPHRRWAFAPVALDTVKEIKNAHGVTVNDVVIAASGGAVRRWLEEHHEVPERSLQALIPISIRTDDTREAIGNNVSAMIAPIGTHLADPLERLHFVHDTMAVAKRQHRATPATLLQDFAQFAPPAVAARAARLVFRSHIAERVAPFNLVISNVPGPHFPLYLAGARLVGHYPVSAIVAGVGLNITLHSYLGRLCFGVVADRELVSDLWHLMDLIEDEVAELAKTVL